MKTKENVTKSLEELMSSKSFESITVKEICTLAEINRSTYYRNFKSKEDIIEYKITLILDEYIKEYEKTNNKTKENYIYTILKTFKKYERFLKTIHKQKQSYIIQKALSNYFKNQMNEDNLDNLYSNYYHIGGIYNFTICWLERNMVDDISELSKIGAEITENTNSLYKIE